jgi:hypothetical protein
MFAAVISHGLATVRLCTVPAKRQRALPAERGPVFARVAGEAADGPASGPAQLTEEWRAHLWPVGLWPVEAHSL